MNLTGEQLSQQGIITGPLNNDNIQQHGIDLNLIMVKEITSGGFIPVDGKTKLAPRIVVPIKEKNIDGKHYMVWSLQPGLYDITFAQGCKVPTNQRLEIYQRSSLLRNGAILRSSVFDAGFETSQIGTVISVGKQIDIEVGARVAQIVAVASNTVSNLYNGQWQGDKQRNNLDAITDPESSVAKTLMG